MKYINYLLKCALIFIGLAVISNQLVAGPQERMRILMSHINPDHVQRAACSDAALQLPEVESQEEQLPYKIFLPNLQALRPAECAGESQTEDLNCMIIHQKVEKDNGANLWKLSSGIDSLERSKVSCALLLSENVFIDYLSHRCGIAKSFYQRNYASQSLKRWRLFRSKTKQIFYLLFPREYEGLKTFNFAQFEELSDEFFSSPEKVFVEKEKAHNVKQILNCASMSSNQTVCSLFEHGSGRWNINLSGHGNRYLNQGLICEFSLDEFHNILHFFNNDLRVNIFIYGSCYAGGKNFHEPFAGIALSFPVVVLSLGNFVSSSVLNIGDFFHQIQRVPLILEVISNALASALQWRDEIFLQNIPQVRLPGVVAPLALKIDGYNYSIVKKDVLENSLLQVETEQDYSLLILEADHVSAPLIIDESTKIFIKSHVSHYTIDDLTIKNSMNIFKQYDPQSFPHLGVDILQRILDKYPFDVDHLLIKKLTLMDNFGSSIIYSDVVCERMEYIDENRYVGQKILVTGEMSDSSINYYSPSDVM